jgi:hypothetical protein
MRSNMELVPRPIENEEALAPREIAEEIYREIIASVKRLEGLYGAQSEHSSLVELRGERAIALRALQRFNEIELLEDVA